MGFYRLQEDACLHVMISDRGSAARATGDAKPHRKKEETGMHRGQLVMRSDA